MGTGAGASERRCAQRMYAIKLGRIPVEGGDYTVDEVAERYDVHRDTVYKGVRACSLLFPQADRKGAGPKAWLHFTSKSVETSDQFRIAFYETTPSWHEFFGDGASAAPARRAAAKLFKTEDEGTVRRKTD